jgi:holo-[acyl-carrier protein] synthase
VKVFTGVDLIEIHRLRDINPKIRERFLQRVFTPQERALCGENTISYAGRFAAKEAVAKALGTGIGIVRWQDIEVLKTDLGEPILYLHNQAKIVADQKNWQDWSLSISHTKEHAMAFFVAIAN